MVTGIGLNWFFPSNCSMTAPLLLAVPSKGTIYGASTASCLLLLAILLLVLPTRTRAQDSSDDMGFRMSRAEVAITVRDSSGEPIKTAGSVKLLRDGMQTGQSALSHGRAFFIVGLLGDYSVVVDAAGYKPAQKEINVSAAVKFE